MDTERTPFLHYEEFRAILDDEAEDIGVDDETESGKAEWRAMNTAGNAIREFYESLIAAGKLRVVEEVEAQYGDYGGIMGWSCTNCSAPCQPDYWGYCPGCGNPIKRA